MDNIVVLEVGILERHNRTTSLIYAKVRDPHWALSIKLAYLPNNLTSMLINHFVLFWLENLIDFRIATSSSYSFFSVIFELHNLEN